MRNFLIINLKQKLVTKIYFFCKILLLYGNWSKLKMLVHSKSIVRLSSNWMFLATKSCSIGAPRLIVCLYKVSQFLELLFLIIKGMEVVMTVNFTFRRDGKYMPGKTDGCKIRICPDFADIWCQSCAVAIFKLCQLISTKVL